MPVQSDEAIENAKKYANCILTMYEFFIKNPKFYLIPNKDIMVCVIPVIRNNRKEIEEFYSSISNPKNESIICGDENYIIEKFINLKKQGVTDIMIGFHTEDLKSKRVHDLLFKINHEKINI